MYDDEIIPGTEIIIKIGDYKRGIGKDTLENIFLELKKEELEEIVTTLQDMDIVQLEKNNLYLTKNGKKIYRQLKNPNPS